MAIRVAFIGAGSVGFTRRLILDLLMVPELRDTHFALHDIDPDNLDRVAQLLAKDIAANDLPAALTCHADRRAALDGAKYVINCTRIGGLAAFAHDVDIPLQYGVDQCVGDTLAPGGIMYGQRNVPEIRNFQRDMRECCAEGALFLNYANPMAINTWAAVDAHDRGEGIDTVGLCHGVQHGHWQIAEALGVDTKAADWKQRVEVICAGINHQTWYIDVRLDGRIVSGEQLLEAFERHERFSRQEKVRIDVLRRFGYYSTESNGHLSEYLPWYRKRPGEIEKWICTDDWIHGETGGYLRVCTEGRNWFKTDFPKWLAEAGQPLDTQKRSAEHGSYIIEAMETGRPYRGHFNVRNRGVIANLPDDCIIEAPGYVDRFGINMTHGLTLPQACAATCRASIDVQRMAKDAAVTGDVTRLKQAMLHDPLTAAVCEPEEIWQMADEMLIAQRTWLPQYEANGAIAAAERRLAHHEKAGTRVAMRHSTGTARRTARDVDTLRAAKQASVLEADKAAAADTRAE